MQTRLQSTIESWANGASGFAVAWVMVPIVYPLFGFEPTLAKGFWITVIFTVVSVLRSYFWRRLFNRLHRRQQHGR